MSRWSGFGPSRQFGRRGESLESRGKRKSPAEPQTADFDPNADTARRRIKVTVLKANSGGRKSYC
jgi:hypothetical protein